MAEPEKLDATFFAFQKRDQRFVLTRATAGYFILYVVLCAIYFALAWSSLGPLIGWYATITQEAMQGGEMAPPPADVVSLIPYGVLIGVLSLILFAAFEAACLRWLVRGESGGGLLGLTPGADTWRVFAIYFLWLGFFIAYFILIALFYVLVNLFAGLGGPARLIALLLGALAPLGFLALLFWGAVRFSPAAAVSIARRRFAFFEAPAVTKGRFWQLLGAFIILWIGYIVIVLIVGTIIRIPAEGAMAPVVADMMRGGGGDIGARMVEVMSSPAYLVSMGAYMVFSAIASTVLYIAMFGVNARAVLAADATQPGAPT
jgi:hypothetical protein